MSIPEPDDFDQSDVLLAVALVAFLVAASLAVKFANEAQDLRARVAGLSTALQEARTSKAEIDFSVASPQARLEFNDNFDAQRRLDEIVN